MSGGVLQRAGDFGGVCLLSECELSPDLLLAGAAAAGLPRSGIHVMGTWRTEDGVIHRFLRTLYEFSAPADRRFYFTNGGGTQLQRGTELEQQLYSGPVVALSDGDGVVVQPPGAGGGFRFRWGPEGMEWTEAGLLDVRGPAIGAANQWFNPWPNGGGALAVSSRFQAGGTVVGQRISGFCGLELHFFPVGRNFLDSVYGWGGREVTWGHMVTEFADGSLVEASLAVGDDGWGFALLRDESGAFHASSEVSLTARLRPNGYPDELTFSFAEQTWIWTCDERGERVGVAGARMVGAEGVLRRAGDTRAVVRAMGTVDWWTDGRGERFLGPN